jgi:hypothetical protein
MSQISYIYTGGGQGLRAWLLAVGARMQDIASHLTTLETDGSTGCVADTLPGDHPERLSLAR